MCHCYVSYSYNCEKCLHHAKPSFVNNKNEALARKLVQAQSHLLRPIIYVCYFHVHQCVFLLVQKSFYVHLE
jgi:hypothetical protein